MATSLRSLVPGSFRPTLRVAKVAGVLLRPRRHLFLFSHMRSYSSLLGHILGSNPEVNGYAELQLSYETELDFIRATLQVYETNGNHLQGHYIFDKVLHGHLTIGQVVLDRSRATGIFVVREPADTLRSTIAMARRRKKPDWKGDIDKVAAYYERRTTQLADLAEHFSGETACSKRSASSPTPMPCSQGSLTFWGLKVPLELRLRGVLAHGPSRRRRSGQAHQVRASLVTERESHDDIEIDDQLLRELEAQRQSCLDRLRRACDRTL